MSYDDEVRNAITTQIGAGETDEEDIDRAIPPLTLKTEDGQFVRVGRMVWRGEAVYCVIPEDRNPQP